jgi:hypothetical protein
LTYQAHLRLVGVDEVILDVLPRMLGVETRTRALNRLLQIGRADHVLSYRRLVWVSGVGPFANLNLVDHPARIYRTSNAKSCPYWAQTFGVSPDELRSAVQGRT